MHIVDHQACIKFWPIFQPPIHLPIIDAAISMADPISGNIHRFISHGNELPLSSWGDGPSGGAIPSMSTCKRIWSIRGLIQCCLTATRSNGSSYIAITQVIFRTILFEGDLRWHLCQWMVQRSGRDRWTLRNMWYPASEGSWYLSGVSGVASLATTPFEWDIRPDSLGGHRYFFYIVCTFWSAIILVGRIVHPGTKQVLSSVGSVGNGYIQVTLQSPDSFKDSQRWTIE